MRRACEALAARLPPPRVFYDRKGERPYFSRYYLAGRIKTDDGDERDPAPQRRRGVLIPTRNHGLYLHHFHRGDDEYELHSHPWRWAVSVVLAGGYSEERLGRGGRIAWRTLGPGSINVLRANTFHRVELIEEDAWTLILTGPKRDTWGFWNRDTYLFVNHREFHQRMRELRLEEGPSP